MKLQQFNDAFFSVLDYAAGAAIPLTISYTGGILYGALFKADKTVAALAFTISRLVYDAFQALNYLLTGGKEKNPKTYLAAQLIGIGSLGVLQIVAYRRLKLIGTLGTILISSFLIGGSVRVIYLLIKEISSSSTHP